MPWTCSWGHFIYSFSYFLIFELGSGHLCILGWHQACDRFTSASSGLRLQRCITTLTHGNNFIILSGRGPSVSSEGGLISLVGFPYVSDQCWVLTWLASTQRRVGGFIEIHPSLQTSRWRRPEKEWVFFGSLDSAALSFFLYRVCERLLPALLARAGWDVSWIF